MNTGRDGVATSKKRVVCQRCHYPERQCICHLVVSISDDTTVWIIQDKLESKHAKNSTRLFKLCYANTNVIAFSDLSAMQCFYEQVDVDAAVLLYPSDTATAIETLDEDKAKQIKHVILLDGTWPKAKKMFLTDNRLKRFTTVNFATPPVSYYEIRKSPNAKALSTLEAAAYCLEALGSLQMYKVRNFFSEVIELQWQLQPDSHKHRTSEEIKSG